MTVDEETKNILYTDNFININTRFALEIGFTNFTPFYPNLKTIWYPEGVYVITDC